MVIFVHIRHVHKCNLTPDYRLEKNTSVVMAVAWSRHQWLDPTLETLENCVHGVRKNDQNFGSIHTTSLYGWYYVYIYIYIMDICPINMIWAIIWFTNVSFRIFLWLTGWLVDLPLWKMMEWKSLGMMTFPTEWKVINFMFQTTNQFSISSYGFVFNWCTATLSPGLSSVSLSKWTWIGVKTTFCFGHTLLSECWLLAYQAAVCSHGGWFYTILIG